MASKLTKKQKQIVDFISDYLVTYNRSPSFREISAGLGLSSVSGVAEHIENLINKGALKKNPGEARSLEVVDLSYPETTELFKSTMITCSEKEKETLISAAKILGISLENN